jgi:hypothetical protein
VELRHSRPQALREQVASVARVALLAGPTVIAFASGGYFEHARLIAAIAAWVVVAVLAIVVDGSLVPRAAATRLALGGLALFTVWVAISRSWAPMAGPAGEDLQRDVLYLGVLVAGVLAWRPRSWANVVEPALAAGIFVVVGYGVLGRLLPGVLDPQLSVAAGGRLDQPLTYWNAMGALAGLGAVLCARVAGDGRRPPILRAAAAAGIPVLGLGLYLTYSRGGLAAVGCGLLVLAILSPTYEQLRSIVLGLVAAGVTVAIGSRLDGVASLVGSAGHREAQGALMLAIVIAISIGAAAVQARTARSGRTGPLPLGGWKRIVVPLAVLAAVALALFPYAAAVTSERGATETNPAFGATASRFGSVGSNRYAYWRVTFHTFADHPVQGAGAASFRVQWLRERPFREAVRDAHSLYFETLAELGIVGFAVLCCLLAGVVLALRRGLAADPALFIGPAAALAVWAVHAGVDWDWEMPGLTLVAMVLAGMVLAQAERLACAPRPTRTQPRSHPAPTPAA